jgi:hypothetical protein
MRTKLLGCLAATAMAAAIVVATPASAFRGGGFGGGHIGGFGGGHFGGFGGGHFGGFAGRSMAMGGSNRGMFTGRSVAMNRGLGFNRGFDPRFARFDHFHHFHHFHDRFFRNRFLFFDDFGFFGVPFAYDYAAYGYGNGCWRWDGWQWINICYNYGGYNYGGYNYGY